MKLLLSIIKDRRKVYPKCDRYKSRIFGANPTHLSIPIILILDIYLKWHIQEVECIFLYNI